MGGVLDEADVPGPGRLSAERAGAWRGRCGGSPPRAGGRPALSVRSSSPGDCGETTSGNFSPVLGHGIALAFLPPDIEDGTAVQVDVRGTALAGTVVATPSSAGLMTASGRRGPA